MRLIGKVALVTGAQQGIGRAIAESLASDGADVAINWLDDERAAQQVAQAVRTAGRRAVLLQGDIASVAVSAMIVQETVRMFGRLNILVNNAGIFPRTPFLDMTPTEWDCVHGVNLRGAAFCAQAAARAMAAGARGGHSRHSRDPDRGRARYPDHRVQGPQASPQPSVARIL